MGVALHYFSHVIIFATKLDGMTIMPRLREKLLVWDATCGTDIFAAPNLMRITVSEAWAVLALPGL